MGSIRRAFSWARNKPDVGEVSTQLRIISKQLARQRNRLEKEERETKARAIQARKEGQIDAFRTYAEEMIRFRKYRLSVDKSRLHTLRILAHIDRTQTSAKTARIMKDVAKTLRLLGDAKDLSKVVQNVDEIARHLEDYDIEADITAEAFDSTMKISADDLAAAIREIDEAARLPDTPSSEHLTRSEELERDITFLEKELGI